MATVGDADRALTAGAGVFYTGDVVKNEPAAKLGGEVRVGRRVKLITENYFLPTAIGVVRLNVSYALGR